MILRDLLPDTASVQIQGSVDVEISHLVYDSRLTKPGALFFALPGTKNDGARFIDQACERGACAVVAPLGTVVTGGVTKIFSDTPRVLLGFMADRFYRSPSAQLTLVGVTGTSGKTTTTYLLEAIWQAMRWSTGVIGTVNYRYQNQQLPAPFTTPEAVELQELLGTMAAHRVSHVVMEVSSHALAQERVQSCRWDGVLFTNLGRDHLDFHRDIEDYFAAKSRLFLQALAASPKPSRFAVVNADDPWGTVLLTKPIPSRVLTYGLQPGVTVSARNVEMDFQGLRGILQLNGEEITFSSALIGEPHLYNILAAATVAYALGIPPERITAGIARCTNVPGRMEAITTSQSFHVIVDYAHKPDALEKVLRSVRQLATNRLLTVFGCGGDRDKGKRPLMGEAAGQLSDIVILTSDNPRTEDPWQIIAEAEVGVIRAGQIKVPATQAVATLQHGYLVIANRRAAIRAALNGARAGDVVVIAGKGHEDYQIIGTTKHHFDDREEVRNYFKIGAGEGQS